jgi:hypothetical protein
MFIRTRLASVSTFLETRAPTKERGSVSFELLPTAEDDHHLDLDTGEVFQDYGYARLHKNEKKLISASMTIRASLDDSDYQYNVMRYLSESKGEDYDPSSIHFNAFIAPTAFRELADNIRGGLYPETITIELHNPFFTSGTNPTKKAPIEFGWEPDGSGMIWHNTEKENLTIPIESVQFHYAVVKPRYDEEQVGRLLPMQLNAPMDRINEQIAAIQTDIAEMVRNSRWTMMGVVALAFMIAIFMYKRGF